MNYNSIDIVFSEVPHEISLAFTITGCSLKCKGCHSSYLWDKNNGTKLTIDNYKALLNKYNNYITCVLFMGGEWHHEEIIQFLNIAKQYHLKTCLYTGEENISKEIYENLTFIKTGKYFSEFGGLDKIGTNQKFIDVETGELLNYLFRD